ncbi:MAG TPA: GNAT family N-acetyltransferase, partial [Thermoanaerobaculia bacterium]|nr:GNAT family N-acetyltransferase [Thermoanaerobaculia bacterium]
MTSSALQLLGYAGSILIATSLLMRSIVRLRAINLAGAATFCVYGLLIGAYPVALLNAMTVTINIVQLVRLRRRNEIFRILDIRPDTPYLNYFLDFQAADIRRFFPAFQREHVIEQSRLALIVLRDLVPAGVLLGHIDGDRLEIDLDYVVPQYRDLKVGRFLFTDEADFFRRRGLKEIVSRADTDAHAQYLRRIGF